MKLVAEGHISREVAEMPYRLKDSFSSPGENKELTLAQIRTLFDAKADMMLAEGYKNGDAAKILVPTTEQDKKRLCLT